MYWLFFQVWTMYGPVPTGLLAELLGADLLEVVDRPGRGHGVAEGLVELGERIAELDLERVVVDGLDAGDALLGVDLVPAVVHALDWREDVRHVRLVVGVGDVVPRVDEVLRLDLAADGRLERDALLQMERPRL